MVPIYTIGVPIILLLLDEFCVSNYGMDIITMMLIVVVLLSSVQSIGMILYTDITCGILFF